MNKDYQDSLKKQEEGFEAMKAFIDSQFNPNGNMENDFTPDIIIYMMNKLQKVAGEHKIGTEAHEDDDFDMEIQQWDAIIQTLSKADKVRESLENESKRRKQEINE